MITDKKITAAEKEVESVLEIALELHMQNTGALEFQTTYDENLKALELRLKKWKPSFERSSKFDNAVKAILEIVVDECQKNIR